MVLLDRLGHKARQVRLALLVRLGRVGSLAQMEQLVLKGLRVLRGQAERRAPRARLGRQAHRG